jgi:GNAT superfamily N-acetyltransferase
MPLMSNVRQHATHLRPLPVNPKVRLALEEDTNAVKACVVAAFEHYIERIGKPPAPMLLDFSAEVQAKHVWVAQEGQRIVGAIVQYETERGFYIDTVAALPASQGMGVGKALLTFAEEEARRRGCNSIYLCTNSKMTENQVFYPRIGYFEYERKHEAGYDRVFYSKTLTSGSAASAA